MAVQKTIRIVLKRSLAGRRPEHRKTVAALGLRKIGQAVELGATPAVLGMVAQVAHMVEVEEKS